MQGDVGSYVSIILVGGAVIWALWGFFKAIKPNNGKTATGTNPPPLAPMADSPTNSAAALQTVLQRIAAQGAKREFILEDESPELLEVVDTYMMVSLTLLMVSGYDRGGAYFANYRAIIANLTGREYDQQTENVAESLWDIKPDGMQPDPFVEEDLIKPSVNWSAAKKEQIVLGALMARMLLPRDAEDEWSQKAQREIDDLLRRVSAAFFGDLAPRIMSSLEQDAATRVASIKAI